MSLWVPDLTCDFLHAKQRTYHQNDYSLWVLALICGFCIQNSDFWIRITNLYGSQTSPVVLCTQYSVISSRNTCLYGSQPSSVVFCMQNSDIWSRITSLYAYQTSPVVLCMQNCVPSIRITSLYGFQPSSVVFACKTATFGPELQVSMGPRPLLSFCACNTG